MDEMQIADTMPPTTHKNELMAFASLSEEIPKYFAQQFLSGLIALNQANLTHNNISPFDIVLSPDLLQAKLSEFDFVHDITSNKEPTISVQGRY